MEKEEHGSKSWQEAVYCNSGSCRYVMVESQVIRMRRFEVESVAV